MIPSPRVFLQLGHIGSTFSFSFEEAGVDADDDGALLKFEVNLTGTNPLRLKATPSVSVQRKKLEKHT
jgi:hypothetical protein